MKVITVFIPDNVPGNVPGAAAPVPEDPQKREAVGLDGPSQSIKKPTHRIFSHSIETIVKRIDTSRVNHMLW